MSATVHDAFVSTGNILAAWKQAIYMGWYDYFHWMGYYTSSTLMSIPPSVFGESFYAAGAIILILALTASTVFFLYTLLSGRIGLSGTTVSLISALTLFLMVQCLPAGMPRVEAFYWYCSGANYILTFSMGLIWLALMIRLAFTSKFQIPLLIATILIGFLLGGGNMMTSLTCAVLCVLSVILLLVYGRLPEKSMVLKRLLAPMIVFFIGFLLCCTAPGNSVREELVSGFGPVKTVAVAIHYTAEYCINQWTRFEHLLVMAILVPVFWQAAPGARLFFKNPLLIIIASYGLAAANIAPPLYALGQVGAGRLQALFYIQYILLLILTEGYLIGWIRMRLFAGWTDEVYGGQKDDGVLRKRWVQYYVFLVFLFVFLSILGVRADRSYYTATEAIGELRDGSALTYRKENEERFRLLRDPDETDVVLAPYSVQPALLYFSDIETDATDWKNDGMMRYYHKNSVKLASDNEK